MCSYKFRVEMRQTVTHSALLTAPALKSRSGVPSTVVSFGWQLPHHKLDYHPYVVWLDVWAVSRAHRWFSREQWATYILIQQRRLFHSRVRGAEGMSVARRVPRRGGSGDHEWSTRRLLSTFQPAPPRANRMPRPPPHRTTYSTLHSTSLQVVICFWRT